jgi:ABC-type sugar transport system substrate-binding protein
MNLNSVSRAGRRGWRKACIGVLAVACVAAASACGSSSPSSSGSSSSPAAAASAAATGGTGVTTAKAAVAAALTEPANIPETTALPHAPKKGVKVAFLTCSAAACSLLNPGFTAAAKALGWDPTVFTYNSATPGQAVQQAIDAGYKYIATTSITLSTITPQVQEAKAKGIALFGAYTSDTPEGATNGLYGVAQNAGGDVKIGSLMADWLIANSDGKANVVYVDIPLYPSLVGQGQGAATEFGKLCPGCTFATLPVSVTQLGAGQVPSAIVSYLQAHPSVNYLYLSFQDLDAGVYAALHTAGLTSRVKIVGTEAQATQLHEMVNGQETMWSILPEPYVMWEVVDWMARQSEGVLTPAALAADDTGVAFIVDTPKAAQAQLAANGGNWPGPVNYQSEFERLWHVGS